MEPKATVPVAAFAKVLRSFQTGGVTYDEFLSEVDQQLAAGASPTDMLDILRQRESVEPLPAYAHTALFDLLNDRHELGAATPPANPMHKGPIKPSAPPELAIVRTGASDIAPETRDQSTLWTEADDLLSEPDDFSSEPDTIFLDDGVVSDGGDGQPAGNGAGRPAAAVGDLLANRFALLELIGVGGMSRVFKASNVSEPGEPKSFVAVKVLKHPFNDQTGSFSEFEKEVRKLQSLSHPNIVRLFECDRDGSTVFMTMEYLVGTSLYERLRGDDAHVIAPRGDAHAVVMAIASALDYAHVHGVVHGDLKPGNVIITDAGEIKLIDFGIAWWIARPITALERREAAKSKFTAGVTPRYASPQLMARHKPEVSDDVYGLACLAYEVFTGIHPFDDGKGAQTLRFPPPMRPGLTASQYKALVNGLQFERRKRTPTVRELMDQFGGTPPRRSWRKVAAWVGVAILALVGGWFLGRPPSKVIIPAPVAVQPVVPPVAEPSPVAANQAGTVIHDCPTCPPMTVLPIGRYVEGSPDGDTEALPSEKPQHSVSISAPFALSTNAVTVADFREFVTATGHKSQGCDIYDGTWHRRSTAGWMDPGFAQSDTHPVTCVSWNDASAYARWLSGKTKHVYRLPSAAEWEYAARAGAAEPRPWGGQVANACAYANVADRTAEAQYPGWNVFGCSDSYVNTAPVGSFKANAFGLNDMLGNVFAWTQDCWHRDYADAPADGTARMDGDCNEHELRGGSWFSAPAFVRAPYRNHFAADYRTSSVGIRLVREVSP